MVDSEVLIVGAGPAGSTAALLLARSGIDVLLVDRHQFPRYKVCGDALIPDAVDMLKRIGLYSDVYQKGHTLSYLRIFAPNGDSILLRGKFITIRRVLFDNILCSAAIEEGAQPRWNLFFESCTQEDSKYKVQFRDRSNNKHSVSARYLIIATGANPVPLKSIGLLQRSRPSAIGVRRYIKVSDGPENELIISCERSLLPGYAWIFPLGKGTYNVGCVLFLDASAPNRTKLIDLYNRFVTESPIAKELLSNPEEQSPLKGAPLRTGFRGTLPGNDSILVVGEALGLTYPASGEGIGKCMESGELAANAILAHHSGDFDGQLSDLYKRFLEEEIRNKYQPYIVAQKWLRYPLVHNLVVKRANKRESIRKLLEDILKERGEPSRIFSLKGLTKIALGFDVTTAVDDSKERHLRQDYENRRCAKAS